MSTESDPRPQTDRWGLNLKYSRRLAGARVPVDGLCWWCKELPATTAEHKYKATDLRRLADLREGDGRADARSLYHGGATYSGELKTLARGTAVQWSKSMCKTCNGERDRHMDRAYQVFSDYVRNHQTQLATARYLDWANLYGEDRIESIRDLARYYAKQVGCLLTQQALPVPHTLVAFLDGADNADNFVFTVVRDPGRRTAQHLAALQGIDLLGYWMPESPVSLTADGTQIATFSHQPYIGFIGVNIDYGAGLGACQPSFFEQNPTPIVQVTGANPWKVRVLMTTGLIRRAMRVHQ